MTPHFPAVTAKELERALKKLGFEIDHITGSHVAYRRASDSKRVVVPRHAGKAIKRKVLSTILKTLDLSPDEFRGYLQA